MTGPTRVWGYEPDYDLHTEPDGDPPELGGDYQPPAGRSAGAPLGAEFDQAVVATQRNGRRP